MEFKSSNPVLSDKIFERAQQNNTQTGKPMTINGTINKTLLLLLIASASGMYTWNMLYNGFGDKAVVFAIAGAIGGFIAAIVTTVKPTWASISGPIYAVLEGLFLGAISAILNIKYPGIAFQAVALTFGTLGVMLLAYRTGLIKVTQKFVAGLAAAMGAIAIFYLVIMVMSLVGADTSFYTGSSTLSIGISLLVVTVAAFNLVIHFETIYRGAQAGAPKYMEWYSGFSLMVALVWLYLEILRLLAKLQDRR